MNLPFGVKRAVAATGMAFAMLAPATPAGAEESHSGRLQIRHTDDWAHGKSSTRYTLHQRSKRTTVKPSEAPRFASGSPVVIRGKKRGGVLRGDVRGTPGVRVAATPDGTWNTAVLLFNFTNNRTEPWTPATVSQRFFTDADSTNVFFKEQSWNQVDLAGDVYGWYRLAQSSGGCDVDAWAKEADAIATAAGVNLGAYDSVTYVFPRVGKCGWSGLAELPGDKLWLNGDISVRVASHELGHNMGVHHASALACSGGAIGGSCDTYEYGDPFSSMGSSTRRMAGWHLEQLGYMQPGNVQPVTTEGSYTISSTLAQATGPQLLKIPRPSNLSPAQYYYVDLRASGGVFDSFALTDPIVQGVTIRIGNDRKVLRQSKLIDTTPNSYTSTLTDFVDAPLGAGRTFRDGSLSITTRVVAGGKATVDVSWSDTEPPTAPPSLAGSDDGTAIHLNWSPSSDNVGVAGYRVRRDGETIATLAATGYRDTAVSPGRDYSYCIEAFDEAGNTSIKPRCTVPSRYVPAPIDIPLAPDPAPDPAPSSSSPSAPPPPVTQLRDRTRPQVTIRTPGRNSKLRRRAKVHATATDNGRVIRMDMIVGKKLAATRKAASLKVPWNLRRVKPGRYTITIVAYDAGGNQARRSIAVRVRR